jgi:hypothetical protein
MTSTARMRRKYIVVCVSDTARALLTAALLSSTALAVYVWKLTRLDPTGPERLIGQLRLAQWAALALAAVGAVSIGLAAANDAAPFGTLEVTLGLVFIVLAGLILQRDPQEALLLAAGAFVLQALFNVAHHPRGLPLMAPAWYTAGCAIYDLFFAAVCYWGRRR